MAERRPVVVYRERLGHASEPFIPAIGERLERHVAHYLAVRPPAGPLPPSERVLPWPDGPLAPLHRYAWKRWGRAPAVTRRLARLRPVLVHAHFGRDAVQLLPWVGRAGVPLVVSFHGHDTTRDDDVFRAGSYSDRLYAERRARLGQVAARCLPVSAFLRERLLARGYPPGSTEVHYLGVDTEAIAARAPERRDPDLVAFVGRLIDQKGVTDFLEAVTRVAARRPATRAVIVGDGPLRPDLEARARASRVAVQFTGALPPADVWRRMGEAAVVVVPSRTGTDGAAEGFGLVAAEAQAAGAGVVCTRNGGLPEAVAPPFEEHLVDEASPEAIAAELQRLLDDPDGCHAKARAATRWIAEHRDQQRQTRRLEDVYEEVVAP